MRTIGERALDDDLSQRIRGTGGIERQMLLRIGNAVQFGQHNPLRASELRAALARLERASGGML